MTFKMKFEMTVRADLLDEAEASLKADLRKSKVAQDPKVLFEREEDDEAGRAFVFSVECVGNGRSEWEALEDFTDEIDSRFDSVSSYK